MIRLTDVPLPAETATQLDAWQRELDAMPDYAARVGAADERFKARNRAENRTFAVVRRHLDAMCYGERRCGYCEDSLADEVEHIRPKALFPEQAFVWRNYIYACGPCNGAKRGRFPRRVGTQVIDVARRRGEPVVAPASGIDVLLDPREDDPSHFFMLDLETGMIVARPRLDAWERQRAELTLEVLPLNRDVLLRARRQQCKNYVARLEQYVRLRDEDELADAEAYARDIRTMGHPMVWSEIRRHQARDSRFNRLFVRAPEALGWEPLPQGLNRAD